MINIQIGTKRVFTVSQCILVATLSLSQVAQADHAKNSKCSIAQGSQNPYETNRNNQIILGGTLLLGAGAALSAYGTPDYYWGPDNTQIFREKAQVERYIDIMKKRGALTETHDNYLRELAGLKNDLAEGKINLDTKMGELTVKEKMSGLSALKLVSDMDLKVLNNKRDAMIREILDDGQILPPENLEAALAKAKSIGERIEFKQNLINEEEIRKGPYLVGGLAMMISGAVLLYKSEALTKSYNDYMNGLTQVPDQKLIEAVGQTLDCALEDSQDFEED